MQIFQQLIMLKTLLSLKTKPRQKQINAFINIIRLHVRKLANFFDLNVNLSYAYRYGEKQTEHLFLNKDLKIYQGYSSKITKI